MEFISVFDVFKIGVGPSSSHTLGPWKAATRFVNNLVSEEKIDENIRLKIQLFGSLSLTGKGHATDLAIMMGLAGYHPETIDTHAIQGLIDSIIANKKLTIGKVVIYFDPELDILFEKDFLPFHANGLIFNMINSKDEWYSETYYSVGGGFILQDGESTEELANAPVHPYPIQTSKQLLSYCTLENKIISEIVLANEQIDRSDDDIRDGLLAIWDVMLDSIYVGCHTSGYLPGLLRVKRRAVEVTRQLLLDKDYDSKESWMEQIRKLSPNFQEILKWVGSFGIAVNEVNASFGRVVTAPTNGSAGVIPAVLMYYLCFVNKNAGDDEIVRFLFTSGEIGSIFKKGSTLSAAMGGCQAEIGVSSAMAAAGLTELLGGSPEQCTIAAEVAMEHHLGMTCDPIGGLVQVPCIERNSMGAIKAINAAAIAMDRNPEDIKVPLDNVISTMWETAKDMNRKYKETSEGGLALTVNIIDC